LDLATVCLVHSILQERSIRGAARVTGRPPSTISAALQRFEAEISVPLVRRDGQNLIPTLEAETRLPHFARLAETAGALANLSGAQDRSIYSLSISLHTLARCVTTARMGSVRSAARAAGIGQPQLARQIGKLEADLGCMLFTRSPQGIHGTAAGVEALRLAEEIGEIWDRLSHAAAERFRKSAATWRLGSVIPFGHESDIAAMLARLAIGWQAIRPRQPLFISSTTADELLAGLKSRRFDLVLLDIERFPAEFEGALIARSRLALAAPRDYHAEGIALPDMLLRHPVAVPSPRSGLRQMADRFLNDTLSMAERARLRLVEVDSIPVIINLVLDHGYLSILPEQSVSRIDRPPSLISIGESYQQSLSLVWPKNALSRQAAETVLKLLRP